MPRPPRLIVADQCYHIINRANRRAEIFHDAGDYAAFIALMARAQERVDLPILAACLMPNHVHLVVRPAADNDIPNWTRWLFTTHVRHYHEKYGTTGRLWQGRYKSFLIQDDHYLLTVLRYVERNAQRAKLVSRAEEWRWGSLNWRAAKNAPLVLSEPPVALPRYWSEFVNQPQTAAEVEAIRTSVNRQRPFGDPDWVERRAHEAGLGQSLISVGRPRKSRCGPFC
ncbi:MAG TPA: transposase [Steroidobacteraceae bacterium]|nr:transposase [Steroidobacteraceae bacterium]